MGFFDWFGKGKREEEWMAQPRRLPPGIDSKTEADQWIMSHEFANNDHKNIRAYMAARKERGSWTIALYKTDLKHDKGEHIYPEYTTAVTADPMDVVRALAEFDRKYRNDEDWITVQGQRGTYRPFANKYGIHFDDDGNIMKIERETRLSTGVFMNRESLDDLFHKAAKTPEIDTWDEVYGQLVNKWPADWTVTEEKLVPAKVLEAVKPEVEAPKAEAPAAEAPKVEGEVKATPESADGATATPPKPAPEVTEAAPVEPPKPVEPKFETIYVDRQVTLEDLSKNPVYPQYAVIMRALAGKLQSLPEDLRVKTTTRRVKEQLVKSLVDGDMTPDFGDEAENKLARRLRNVTVLVGLLRAGEELYQDFAKGKFSPDGMNMMSFLGQTASKLAAERLGVDQAASPKIADIISRGKDPAGTEWPVDKLFTQFPPAVYTSPKAAPPPKRPPGPSW